MNQKTQNNPIKLISNKQFLRIFKDNFDNKSESRFCFIIGSGASVNSAIKSGDALSNKWLKEIEEDLTSVEYNKWITDNNIEKEKPEEFYGQIYQKRFEHDTTAGHEALLEEMANAKASVGYPLFASFLADDKHNHNIVITTNFDSLIESSVYRYTNKQPLVIGHENLAHFLRASTKRPIVAKIHRDLLLEPKNRTEEISSLPSEWEQPLKQIFETSKVIVIGYGGNDGSLMDFLSDKCQNIPSLYWCVRSDDEHTANSALSNKVYALLNKANGRLAAIKGFDELMFDLSDIYDSDNLLVKDTPESSKIVEDAIQRAKEFQIQIDDMSKQELESDDSSRITKHKLSSDWVESYRKINSIKDHVEKESAFSKAIKANPHPYLYALFAQFLKDHRRYPEAEIEFKNALALTPDDAIILGNYALFLTNQKKDFEQAETFYHRAIEADPNHANNLGNYALFLINQKQDFEQAETFYLRAIEADPNDANNLGNYAVFLNNQKQDFEQAETAYLKAIEADPNDANNLGNYAVFLNNQKQDFEQAETAYLKAIEADPNHANTLRNYALFLTSQKQDFKQAETFYLRAIEADPNDANNLGNYALFLKNQKQDFEQAETFYLRAIEADPNDANNLGNYASFLKNLKQDFEQAENFYLRAIGVRPKEPDLLGNYAGFLFANGRKEEGIKFLTLAYKYLSTAPQPETLKLELCFYEYTHLEDKLNGAKNCLEDLLENGINSENFDLSLNVQKAIDDGHPEPTKLKEYAERISKIPFTEKRLK